MITSLEAAAQPMPISTGNYRITEPARHVLVQHLALMPNRASAPAGCLAPQCRCMPGIRDPQMVARARASRLRGGTRARQGI